MLLKAGETNPQSSPHLVHSAQANAATGPLSTAPATEPQPKGSEASPVTSYFEAALQVIAERAQAGTGASGAAIALGDASEMVCRASIGAAPDVGVQLRSDAGLSGYCLRSGEVVLCTDTQSDPRVNASAARSMNLGSIVILPVFAAGRLSAVLQVLSPRPGAFGVREMNCLEQLTEVLGATLEEQQRFRVLLVSPEPAHSGSPEQPEVASRQPGSGFDAAVAKAPEDADVAGWWPHARGRFTVTPPDWLRIAIPIAVLILLLGAGWYARHRSAAASKLTTATAAEVVPATPATISPPPPSAASMEPEAPPSETTGTTAKPPAPADTASAEPSRPPKVTTGLTTRALVNRVNQMKVENIASLERRAKAGDPEAQVTLGLAYSQGNLLKRDPAQAVTWYRKAAEREYSLAEEALGVAYQTGHGVAKDSLKAVQWYTRAAQHGSLMAANELGMMHSTAAGVPRNFSEARKWYSMAAERGDASAQFNLARMYHLGQGVPANPALEFQWLTKAAKQGLAAAQFALALMYQDGVGVKADAAHAARLLRQAADQGDRLAQMQLGYAYLKGLGVPVDSQQSLKWYRAAAEQGEPTAAYALSVRYFTGGQGVTQNSSEAGKWTRVAAENGHPDAQYNLGVMYEEGIGIPPNPVEAAKWYRRACDQEVASAQLRLGLMYATGKGIPKDLLSAYKWISLGETDAKASADRLHALQKEMTPEQIRDAELAVKKWRAEHQGRQP